MVIGKHVQKALRTRTGHGSVSKAMTANEQQLTLEWPQAGGPLGLSANVQDEGAKWLLAAGASSGAGWSGGVPHLAGQLAVPGAARAAEGPNTRVRRWGLPRFLTELLRER